MNEKLSCIIVEDDELATTLLSRWCQKHEDLELKGCFENGVSAIEFLKEESVDLVFLDIELSDMKGWELLDQLAYRPCVIVTSSNKDYAVEAFAYKVADFIQKPIAPAALDISIQKVMAQQKLRNSLQASHKEVYIKSNGKLYRIEFDKIIYIENLADYVKVFTENGNHVIYCTMKHLEKRLPSSSFVKIHRSYIINMNKINFIEDNDVMIGDRLIPLARSQKLEFLEKLNML